MRVSTVKNYDNKDVIKQIFDLNARTGAMETSLAPVAEALSQGIATSQQLDAETNARIDGDALLRSGVDASVNGVLIEGTDTSMTVTVEKNTGPPLTTPLPVASPLAAGVMNAETFNSIVTMQNRVTALENRQLMYTVTLATEHPTQSEVTTAYTTTYPTAPNPPLTGTVVADLPKNFQCTWDGNQNIWVKTVVGVGQATNDTHGIVKGANSQGKAFVETDGTMSVVGWDGLGARVTAVEADMSEVDEALALKADKTELALKADKTGLALKADKTELGSLIAPLLPPVDCNAILTMYKNNTSITASHLINAENCTSLASVFYGCTNLATVRYIYCPNVTTMYEMFRNCSSLTTIPLLDTSKATDMGYMFRNCGALTSVTFQCNGVRPYGSNMFTGTPIASGSGRIYVPDNLVQAYKTASGWSAHASVIYGHSARP